MGHAQFLYNTKSSTQDLQPWPKPEMELLCLTRHRSSWCLWLLSPLMLSTASRMLPCFSWVRAQERAQEGASKSCVGNEMGNLRLLQQQTLLSTQFVPLYRAVLEGERKRWRHRITEWFIWRDLRSSNPTPCSEQGHLQLHHVGPSPVQCILELFQGFFTSLSSLLQPLTTPTVKIFLLDMSHWRFDLSLYTSVMSKFIQVKN